jgi:SAM-dependent methyltransferase
MMPVCPFCGETAGGATRFEGIYRCVKHGAFEWFARERLGDVDLIGIYQSYPYCRAIRQEFERMEAAYVRGLRQRVLKYFPRTEGISFLDVGCANGEYLRAARILQMKSLAGVEVDEEAISRATAYGSVFTSLDDLAETFDIVQCKNVLTNIPDFQAFFHKLLLRTKPGGVLFLDILNQFGLVSRIKKMLGKPGLLRPPYVINGFSKTSVAELARMNGTRLTWMTTSYVGSDIFPYRKSLKLLIRGRFTRMLGAATVIAADIRV